MLLSIVSSYILLEEVVSKLKLPQVKMGRFEILTPMFHKVNLRKTNRIFTLIAE